ncbi:cobalt-precorrin-5B (C(1))-methyltransferase CbiD [Pyrobaculum aerophilum]|uniref:cobalt-precorrin-5B (C(1))-methyltransferase CbiD n=1 Tax=Pyrobaculum aerophilum TaxID=13773 RepID=UPI002FDB16DD
MNPFLKYGITTGLAAAAAAKAAALYSKGIVPKSVTVPTPIGLRVEVFVERVFQRGEIYCAEVRKFSGDNPDVLNGVIIRACVRPLNNGVVIKGGEGVGIVTRPGLPVPPGEHAINPVPRRMIEEAVREVLEGAEVLVEVPDGKLLAEKTMNPRLGIVGGISILGTTGIEAPVSADEFLGHIEAELSALRERRDIAILAQGNTSYKAAQAVFGDVVVKIGDMVGYAVEKAAALGYKAVYLFTMPGKLAKLALGAYNTHSAQCDGRVEAVLYALVKLRAPYEVLLEVSNAASVGEALAKAGDYAGGVIAIMARRAKEYLERFKIPVEIYVVNDKGEVLFSTT